MMKEQNELLKRDKMLLANNLADISHQLKNAAYLDGFNVGSIRQ